MKDTALSCIIFGFLIMLSFSAISLADSSTQSCIDNVTLNVTSVSYINGNAIVVSSNTTCPTTCLNGECSGSSIDADMIQIYVIFALGALMLILAVILGMPIGNSQRDIRKPFNTTIIVKYIFFFLGIWLMWFGMGMMRRVGITYGGNDSVTTGTDTVITVMMIVMMFFLFIFMLEFTVSVINMLRDSVKRRKAAKFGREDEDQ